MSVVFEHRAMATQKIIMNQRLHSNESCSLPIALQNGLSLKIPFNIFLMLKIAPFPRFVNPGLKKIDKNQNQILTVIIHRTLKFGCLVTW